jgi:hypothetical protein
MKRFPIFLPVLLLCVTSSCTPSQQRLQQARSGLDTAIAQLPSSAEFTVVAIIPEEFSSTDYGKTCYYAQANIAVGTALPGTDALATYVNELTLQGWVVERDNLDRSRVLVRGEHERIAVSLDGPGWIIERDEDYQHARDTFPIFLYISVTYILPSRENC